MTATNFQSARRNMVEYQIRCCKVLDPSILDLIESMPRENFVPEHVRSLAYMEGHVPLPCGQEMLSPLQEANILQKLQLNGSERVLEIGAGTGFLTTMLAMLASEVISCELHEELAKQASANIANHGVTNAKVISINAMDEAAMSAEPDLKQPFDVIVLGAASLEIPEHLLGMLREGGQIIAFIGENPVVSLVNKRKIRKTWQTTKIFETLLQNIEGVPEKREFVF